MYYSRKKTVDHLPKVLTPIWACTVESCNGWMRDNFAFAAQPTCLLCASDMVKSERMLAEVANTSPTQHTKR